MYVLLAAAIVAVLIGVAVTVVTPDHTPDSGPTIGAIPNVVGRPLTADDLPDLIPLVDDAGTTVGFARSDELYVDLFYPDREFLAAGVYEADGITLIGYEIPGQGFTRSTVPMATSRAAR